MIPTIKFKNNTYFFDYRLKQIRLLKKLKGELFTIKFTDLNDNQAELLKYAIESNDKKLIETNMKGLI